LTGDGIWNILGNAQLYLALTTVEGASQQLQREHRKHVWNVL